MKGEQALDFAALADWMDAQGLGTGPIHSIERLAGGTQNILLRFIRDGRPFVLRRPPLHVRPKSNQTMEREARLLGAIARTPVPHAALIAASDAAGRAALGVSFYLMEPIEGFNPTVELPSLHAGDPAVQHRMGLAIIEGIAALGALDHLTLGLEDFGRSEGFLARQVSRWSAQLDSYAEFEGWPGRQALPDVEGIGKWLETNRPTMFMPGIMHGDFHMANVMYRPDSAELAAIVDWELATIGDPLLDLGWLLATWPSPGAEDEVSVKPWIGFPHAEELVAHYAARSSRDLSAIGWYKVLACYKLGILLEGTFARACAGKASQDVGQRLHSRAQWLIRRAVAEIETPTITINRMQA